MDNSKRISELERAERLILDAADIVESALHMSGMEGRFGDIPSELRSLASSYSRDSVRNAARELEYLDEEQPGWTRPLASVKNVNRKDI